MFHDRDLQRALKAVAATEGWQIYKDYWFVQVGEFFFYQWRRPASRSRLSEVIATTYVKPMAVDDVAWEYQHQDSSSNLVKVPFSYRCDGVDTIPPLQLSRFEVNIVDPTTSDAVGLLVQDFTKSVDDFRSNVHSVTDFLPLVKASTSPSIRTFRLELTTLIALGRLSEAALKIEEFMKVDITYAMVRESLGEKTDLDMALAWIRARI